MIAIEQGVQLNDVHRFHMRTLSRSIGRVQPEVCREAIHGRRAHTGGNQKVEGQFCQIGWVFISWVNRIKASLGL